MSIGQVAERTGLSVHTLRFYEREGLLAQPVRRGTAGHRVYSEDDVGWLGVCMRLRASGMPLTDIRRYTDLVRAGQGNEADRLEVLREHRERILARMDELDACLRLITHKVAIYEGRLGLRDEVPDCVP
ncbi:MerR family transcriptional regulator [Actinomadura sp. ATCC 31491]|uniref:MerR family transcriptional regulator n=1 Tax=Actinomadura luzonensis TaxID=2805427 RepID=A0ABT0FN17_9ACTN|nr:MerR family transcriptional regulator [Actinomadura luzonensis]